MLAQSAQRTYIHTQKYTKTHNTLPGPTHIYTQTDTEIQKYTQHIGRPATISNVAYKRILHVSRWNFFLMRCICYCKRLHSLQAGQPSSLPNGEIERNQVQVVAMHRWVLKLAGRESTWKSIRILDSCNASRVGWIEMLKKIFTEAMKRLPGQPW